MKSVIVGINSKYIHTMLSVRYLTESVNKSLCGTDSYCVFKEFSINMNRDLVLEALYNENADIYCFSTYIFNVEYVLDTVGNLKKLLPYSIIILGGPEVSYENENILRQNPEIDFISCGEGERALPNLINLLVNTSEEYKKKVYDKQISGTSFIYEGFYISYPFESPICNLDILPFPYTDFELKNSETQILYYESSRGCPFGCSYCLSSTETKVRFKSIEKVCSELDRFIDNNVKLVKFIDRTFNVDTKRAEDIISYIIKKDNGITSFHFEIAPWIVSDTLAELIKSARKGLFQLEIGIQSTNNETLSAINRKVCFEHIKSSILKLKSPSTHIHIDLIAGLPYETFDIFKKSFNDAMSLECECLQLGFLKMLKGTSITHQYEHCYVYEEKPPYQVLYNKYISYTEMRKLERISRVLDLYCNSGLCSFMSSSKLRTIFHITAFEFYMGFSEWLDSVGFFEVLHSTVSLFDYLYKYLSLNYDEDMCESLVAYDYYKFTCSSSFPTWLKTIPDKNKCRELLDDENLLFSLMDDEAKQMFKLKGKKHWFRKTRFVSFEFDTNGEKNHRECLFIYSKDTLIVSIPK